jgi:hypothetical protein
MDPNQLEIDLQVRGDYKSADLYLLPRAEQYATLLHKAFLAFEEDEVEIVINEHSMPLPYFEALEIPLDVFSEKYGVEKGDTIGVGTAVDLARDLLSFGLFDIGFKGDRITAFISHDGYLNIKPRDIDQTDFKETLESLRGDEA